MSNPAAFDALAADYDDQFTDSQIGRWLRGRVHARMIDLWQPGQHLLELGCGTGEDARFLAQQGIRVTATDASPKMLSVAQQKLEGIPGVQVAYLNLHAPTRSDEKLPGRIRPLDQARQFDGTYANFGVLNVLGDWRPLAHWLAERVHPGAIVAFGIMSRYCLWEPLWHGAHLNLRTAFRRLGGRSRFQASSDSPLIDIHYPTVRRLQRDFSSDFEFQRVIGLGVFLPPSDVYVAVEKRTRLLKLLTALEERTTNIAALAQFADHYWIEFKRK